LTCVNQPQFKAVIGEVELCAKAAQFDAKKYNELFGKKKEKAGKTPKKEEPKKQQPAKKKEETKKDEDEDEDDDTPKAPTFKDPYADLPKSSFVMDVFKRCYSNEDTITKAIPHFWENFDKEGWSIWKATYLYPEDVKLGFMASNLVSGMFQRIEKLRKTAFASILILGEKEFQIEGVWVMRGQKLAFDLVEDWNTDAPSYKFEKLDPDSAEDKVTVNKYFSWEGDFGGRPVVDGKIFK
jgi:elongation factor 1-gamma